MNVSTNDGRDTMATRGFFFSFSRFVCVFVLVAVVVIVAANVLLVLFLFIVARGLCGGISNHRRILRRSPYP